MWNAFFGSGDSPKIEGGNNSLVPEEEYSSVESEISLVAQIKTTDPHYSSDATNKYISLIKQYVKEKTKSDEFVIFLDQASEELASSIEQGLSEGGVFTWVASKTFTHHQMKTATEAILLGMIFNFLEYVEEAQMDVSGVETSELTLLDRVFLVLDGKKGDLKIENIFQFIQTLADPTQSDVKIQNAEDNLPQSIFSILNVICPYGADSLMLPRHLDFGTIRNTIWSKLNTKLPIELNIFFEKIRLVKQEAEVSRKTIQEVDKEGKIAALTHCLGQNFSCFARKFLQEDESKESQESNEPAKESELFKRTMFKALEEIKKRKKGELESIIEKATSYGEPILLHIFANFAKKHGNRTWSLLSTIIADPLFILFNFSATYKESIVSSYTSFIEIIKKRGEVGNQLELGKIESQKQKEESALTTLKSYFNPLAQSFLKENCLDANGLKAFLPFGSASLAKKIQSQLVDFFADCYCESISLITHEKKPHCVQQAKLSEVESAILEGEKQVIYSLIQNSFPSMIDSLSKDEKGAMGTTLLKIVNDVLPISLPSTIDKDFFSLPIKELVGDKVIVSSLRSFLQPFLSETIIQLLSQLSFGQGKRSLLPGALETVLGIIDEKISFSQFQNKLVQWHQIPDETEEERIEREGRRDIVRKMLDADQIPSSREENEKDKDRGAINFLTRTDNEEIAHWKKMPEKEEAEIDAKKQAKAKILSRYDSPKEQSRTTLQKFLQPVATDILSKAGWSNPKNIPVPTACKKSLKKSMEEVLLADLLIEVGSRLFVLPEVSQEQMQFAEKIESKDLLQQLLHLQIPKFLESFGKEDSPEEIAYSLMLSDPIRAIPSEEAKAILGKDLQEIAKSQTFFPNNRRFLNQLASLFSYTTVEKLAFECEEKEASNDIILRAIQQLFHLIQTTKIPSDHTHNIAAYEAKIAKLKKLQERLVDLRKQAIVKAPDCPQGLLEEIEKLKKQCLQIDPRPELPSLKEKIEELELKIEKMGDTASITLGRQLKSLRQEYAHKEKITRELDEHEKTLSEPFQSLVTSLLDILGYQEAKDLPLPFVDQESWDKCKFSTFPNFLLDMYRTLWVPEPIYQEKREKLNKEYPGQVCHLNFLVELSLQQVRKKLQKEDTKLIEFVCVITKDLGFSQEWLSTFLKEIAHEKNDWLWKMVTDFVTLRVQEMAAELLLGKRRARKRSNLLHDLFSELYMPLDHYVSTKRADIKMEIGKASSDKGRNKVALQFFSTFSNGMISSLGWDNPKAFCIPFFGKSIVKNLQEAAPELLLDFFFPIEGTDKGGKEKTIAETLSSSVNLTIGSDQDKDSSDDDELRSNNFQEESEKSTSEKPRKLAAKSHILTDILGERLQGAIARNLTNGSKGIQKAADKFLALFSAEVDTRSKRSKKKEKSEDRISLDAKFKKWIYEAFSHMAKSPKAQEAIDEIPEKVTALANKNAEKGQDLILVIFERLKSQEVIDALIPLFSIEGNPELLSEFTNFSERLVANILKEILFDPEESLPIVIAGKVWHENLKPALIGELAKMLLDLSKEYRAQKKYAEVLASENVLKHVDALASISQKFLYTWIEKKKEFIIQEISKKIVGKKEEEVSVAEKADHELMQSEIADRYLPHSRDKEVRQVLHGETKALLYRFIAEALGNIKKLEEQDPLRMFRLSMSIIKRLTKHLALVNKLAENNKCSISELRYGHLESELLQKQTKAFDSQRIKVLQKERNEVSDDGELERFNMLIKEKLAKIDSYLEGSNEKISNQDDLEKLLDLKAKKVKKINQGVDSEFFLWALQVVNIHEPRDLPGLSEYNEEVWEILTTSIGPALIGEIFSSAFESKNLNKYFFDLLASVNKHLEKETEEEIEETSKESKTEEEGQKEPQEMVTRTISLSPELIAPDVPISENPEGNVERERQGPEGVGESPKKEFPKISEEEKKNYVEDCVSLLKNLGIALPGTLGTLVYRTSSFGSTRLVDAMYAGFQETNMLYFIKMGLSKGAEGLPEALEKFKKDHVDEPVTEEQINAELVKILPNYISSQWRNFQKVIDDRIKNWGPIPIKMKKVVDDVCRAFIIDIFVALSWWFLKFPINHFVVKYSKAIREASLDTPVHTQFARGVLREVMEKYKIDSPASVEEESEIESIQD